MGLELDELKEVLFIKKGKVLHKVKVRDILCLSSDGNYVTILTKDHKYITKISLKRMVEFLPQNGFVQIHRSHIVQIGFIEKIDLSTNELFIGEFVFTIGRKFKSELLGQLNLIQ